MLNRLMIGAALAATGLLAACEQPYSEPPPVEAPAPVEAPPQKKPLRPQSPRLPPRPKRLRLWKPFRLTSVRLKRQFNPKAIRCFTDSSGERG
ncbi:hypothetical protein [Brevundimonas diminuta]|nr:hypothetical protein [Brevundimonas diminuta]